MNSQHFRLSFFQKRKKVQADFFIDEVSRSITRFQRFFPDPVPHPDLARMAERLHLFSSWRKVVTRYGFREYDGPPLETLELYKAKSGAEIVHQLYHFEDKEAGSCASG